MQSHTKGKLDPSKTIDVVKYATILGNPLQPLFVERWMEALLAGKAPTFENKLEAMCTQGVTLKFLTDKKATVCHPEMKEYKKVLLRVRAVRGFFEWDAVHQRIVEEVG